MAEAEQRILPPQIRKMLEKDLDQVVELGRRVAEQARDSNLLELCQRPFLLGLIKKPEAVLLVAEVAGLFDGFLAASIDRAFEDAMVRFLLTTSGYPEVEESLINQAKVIVHKRGARRLFTRVSPGNETKIKQLQEQGFSFDGGSKYDMVVDLQLPK